MAFEKKEETATKEKPESKDKGAPKAVKPEEGEQAKKAAPKSKPKGKPRKPGPKTLEGKLQETVQGLGTLAIMAGQVHDGVILYSRSDSLAHAWSQAADQNKQIERILRMLTEGGVWGGVLITTTSVVFPIMQNHGLGKEIPNPFALAQSDVDALPDEMQQMVAMYQQQAKEEAAKAQAVPGTGMPGGGANGAPA